MGRMKLTTVVLLVAALALSACGSSQPKQSSPQQATSGAVASPRPSAAAQQPAGSPPVAGASQPSSAPASAPPLPPLDTSGPGPALKDLLAAKKTNPYKVTFQVSGTVGGQAISGAQTWTYKDPNFRMDSSMGLQGAQINASTYIIGNTTYSCTGLTGQMTCVKLPKETAAQQGNSTNPAFDMARDLEQSIDQFTITYKGSQQIAGQKAYCYDVQGSAPSTQNLQMVGCYGEKGAPLRTSVKGAAFSTEMVATQFSTSVADSDFQLPGPVLQLPFQPGQLPLPSPSPSPHP